MISAVNVAFLLVKTIVHPLWVLDGGIVNSLITCGAVCMDSEVCGGFVYDSDTVPSCRLVVDSAVPAAVQYNTQNVYRMINYKERYRLFEFVLDYTATEARDFCKEYAMDLPPHPVSYRDRAIFYVREGDYFYLDLKRLANGSIIVWSTGEAVTNTSFIKWEGMNPEETSDSCVGTGFEKLEYYDYSCDSQDPDPNTVFCALRTW